jgi:chromosome segregation ATPase
VDFEQMALASYRITDIFVEGFRGFTTPQSLSFEGRNVFVFGPNGYGKSSVIEAVHWCFVVIGAVTSIAK